MKHWPIWLLFLIFSITGLVDSASREPNLIWLLEYSICFPSCVVCFVYFISDGFADNGY